MLRDHQPITIDQFNGLYDRGDKDNTPLDHFSSCENIKSIGDNSFGTRDGIGISQDVNVPLSNVKRIYNYSTPTGNTLIVLIWDNTTVEGKIYHVVDSATVYGPILTIVGMTDFGFQAYAGRGYITPFSSLRLTMAAPTFNLIATPVAGTVVEVGIHKYAYSDVTAIGETIPSPLTLATTTVSLRTVNLSDVKIGNSTVLSRNIYRTIAGGTQLKLLYNIPDNTTTTYVDTTADGSLGVNAPTTNTAIVGTATNERGLENEFLYVYMGDGTAARKAGGSPLSGSLTIANGAAGHTDAGFHLFAFVAETNSGFLTAPGAISSFTTVAGSSASFSVVPTSGSPIITKRHLVVTRAITDYNGDTTGYTFYFVPGATIDNNTDTFLNNISFYDADLLSDASHLIDNYAEIPAGVGLTLYHNRLCLYTTFNDISIVLVSAAGEPEAISQIDGLLIFPLDGNPITNAQELRDIFYVFKRASTIGYVDNGDVPSSWLFTFIDKALGTSVHGIATVLDSGTSSVDFLVVCTYQGVSLFNGKYITPELGWKIENYWKLLDRDEFRKIQAINAVIQKEIYIVLPTRKILVGNYAKGFNPKNIRWTVWSYIMGINTIAIHNIDEIVLGSDLI